MLEYTYRIPVSGSYEPPGQLAPFAMYAVPILPPSPRAIGGVNSGPSLMFDATFFASASISGVKSIRSFS